MNNIAHYVTAVAIGIGTLACTSEAHRIARQAADIVVETGIHEVYSENGQVVDSYHKRIPITQTKQDELDERVINVSRLMINDKERLIVGSLEIYDISQRIYMLTQIFDGIPQDDIDGVPQNNLPLDGRIDHVNVSLGNQNGIYQEDDLELTEEARARFQDIFEENLEKWLANQD